MFSKATEYALRATIYIAKKGSEEKKLGIPEIAKAIDSPESFTAKILQALTGSSGIISSVRGPGGGFYISEKSRRLPARAILKAMGEEEQIEKCVLGLKQCSSVQPCPMHEQYKLIRQQLVRLFASTSIQQLADEMKEGEVYINNTRK